MKDLKTGNLITSSGVTDKMYQCARFSVFCQHSLEKHKKGDWGNVEQEDWECNDLAFEENDRIVSQYSFPPEVAANEDDSIYIITEYDRSVTTILFPSEY